MNLSETPHLIARFAQNEMRLSRMIAFYANIGLREGMSVRGCILWGIGVAATCISLFVSNGCIWDTAEAGSNCPPDIWQECCICPWPEDCPEGAPAVAPSCDGGDAEDDAPQQ
jgi:hypothetical protein